jgi:hypothetical protein
LDFRLLVNEFPGVDLESKQAALVDLTGDLDIATHEADELAATCQPEACPTLGDRACA